MTHTRIGRIVLLAAGAVSAIGAGCGSGRPAYWHAGPSRHAERAQHRPARELEARPVRGPEPRVARKRRPQAATATVRGDAYDTMLYRDHGVNRPVRTGQDSQSTFALDVDTGSYTLVRSYLQRGHLPPREAVRVEEFVNYFDYGYAAPPCGGEAFAIHTDAAPSPFRPAATLLRVGLKARPVSKRHRRAAVLTFVIDVSGSVSYTHLTLPTN